MKKRKRLFFFLSRKQKRKNIAEAQRKNGVKARWPNQAWWTTASQYLKSSDSLMATRVTLLTCCRSCSWLSWQHRSSGTILLACKVGVIDYVVSNAGIDYSSVERWLSLMLETLSEFWMKNSCWKRSFIIQVETLLGRENNPCRSSLNQKFSFVPTIRPKNHFSRFFLQVAAKSSTLPHVSLMAKMRTKSTRALSFSSIPGQNDQLRLTSSQAALKAFQTIFP